MNNFISYTISILFSNIDIISVNNINIPKISNTKARLSKSHLSKKRENCFQRMMPDGNRQATLVRVSVSHGVYHVRYRDRDVLLEHLHELGSVFVVLIDR